MRGECDVMLRWWYACVSSPITWDQITSVVSKVLHTDTDTHNHTRIYMQTHAQTPTQTQAHIHTLSHTYARLVPA